MSGELVLGALLGVLVGVLIGSFLRPVSARLERTARALWRESPLLMHVERDPAIIWAGEPDWKPFSVYFREISRAQSSRQPESRTEWLNWARHHGGIDVDTTQLSVTLQAKTDVAVVIEGLRVKSRSRPVDQGVVVTRPTGGADLTPRHFHIDLDWGPEPVVTYYEVFGEPAATPHMKIAAGDVEQFHIWAQASQDWHEWTVELLLLVEGRRVIHKINDDGAPFRTVGAEGLDHIATGSEPT